MKSQKETFMARKLYFLVSLFSLNALAQIKLPDGQIPKIEQLDSKLNICELRLVGETGQKRLVINFHKILKDGRPYSIDMPSLGKNESPTSKDYLRSLKQAYMYRTGQAGYIDPAMKCDVMKNQGEICELDLTNNDRNPMSYLKFSGQQLTEHEFSLNELKDMKQSLVAAGHCQKAKEQKLHRICTMPYPEEKQWKVTISYHRGNLDNILTGKFKSYDFKSESEALQEICGNWNYNCPDGILSNDSNGSLMNREAIAGWCGSKIAEIRLNKSMPKAVTLASKQ